MTDNRSLEQGTGTETSGGRSTPRQRAIEAYGSARDRVGDAGRRAGETLEEAPLIVTCWPALAAGAAIAALLPRTRTEERLLRPVSGPRARNGPDGHCRSRKDAGRGRLDELGLTRTRAPTPSGRSSKAPATPHALRRRRRSEPFAKRRMTFGRFADRALLLAGRP